MDHGVLLALDEPAKLKKSVGADTVVRLEVEGDAERLVAPMKALDRIADASVVDGTLLVKAREAQGLLPRIIATAEDAGYVVRDASMTEPTLETVFITLTGKELRE